MLAIAIRKMNAGSGITGSPRTHPLTHAIVNWGVQYFIMRDAVS
jgi:hypothetical protein